MNRCDRDDSPPEVALHVREEVILEVRSRWCPEPDLQPRDGLLAPALHSLHHPPGADVAPAACSVDNVNMCRYVEHLQCR